jgi:hypothetical protein
MLAALGVLVGYGSYRFSKKLLNTRRKNDQEEKKADYKYQKLKNKEIQNTIRLQLEQMQEEFNTKHQEKLRGIVSQQKE